MITPKSFGNASSVVFSGETNSNGIFFATDMSGIKHGLSKWVKVLGPGYDFC